VKARRAKKPLKKKERWFLFSFSPFFSRHLYQPPPPPHTHTHRHIMSMSDSVLNGLALQHFGIEKLQEAQLESIRAVVAKENVFVFLKTGSGKTLCFSLVPLVFKDLLKKEVAVLVVSPLIALMKQQVADLESGGHAAVYLCGENKEIALEKIKSGKMSHIFVTPEQAMAVDVLPVLISQKAKISLLVVDEAHCLVESTDNFRPTYKHIGTLRTKLGVPVMALTATPTAGVRSCLPVVLAVSTYTIVEESLDRPELFLEVRAVKGLQHFEAAFISSLKEAPGLTMIFCQNKEKVCDLFEEVRAVLGAKAGLFQASLTEGQKALVLKRARKGDLSCLLTTSALGMGMNLPNVQWVVLFGPPYSPLDLVQQLGRASRERGPDNGKLRAKGTLMISQQTQAAVANSQPLPSPPQQQQQQQQQQQLQQPLSSTSTSPSRPSPSAGRPPRSPSSASRPPSSSAGRPPSLAAGRPPSAAGRPPSPSSPPPRHLFSSFQLSSSPSPQQPRHGVPGDHSLELPA